MPRRLELALGGPRPGRRRSNDRCALAESLEAGRVMGGAGLLTQHHVGKAFADMEAYYTYEGTFDINLLIAGRAHTGHSAIKPRL